MFSIETEKIVSKLFMKLAEDESLVEATRQNLCEMREFDPLEVFRYIDKTGSGFVDDFSIYEILRKNSIFPKLEEVRRVVSFYDTDQDNRLNLEDFLSLVVTATSPNLRKHALEESLYSKNKYSDKLPYKVEYTLVKLFLREFDLEKALSLYVNQLHRRYDFNISDLFNNLDAFKTQFITKENFKRFLLKNNCPVTDREVEFIANRFDINKNGRITINELKTVLNIFSERINGSRDELCKIVKSDRDYYSQKRNIQNSSIDSIPDTTLKTMSYVRHNENTQYSPNKSITYLKQYHEYYPQEVSEQYQTYSTQIQVSRDVNSSKLINSLNFSYDLNTSKPDLKSRSLMQKEDSQYLRENSLNIHNDLSFNFNKNDSYTFKTLEEEVFQHYFKELTSLENEIEKLKCDLTLKADFNFPEAFRLFENNGRGILMEADLKQGLNILDAYPSTEDIDLLLKRFSSRQNGYLSFSDFCELIAPIDSIYFEKVKSRQPDQFKTDKYYMFYNDTKLLLGRVFRAILECERKLEKQRQRMSNLPNFSIKNIFNRLDNGKGFITHDDVATYFIKNSIAYLKRDIDFIFYRFDIDGDGKINFSEFQAEVYPKSLSCY